MQSDSAAISPPKMKVRAMLAASSLAVAVLTSLVFAVSLDNGFVTWDDDLYVYENFHIRSLDSNFVRWALHTYHAGNWHPLTWLSHALDYAFWGLTPWGHHLTSVLIHGLNSGLVVLMAVFLMQPQRPGLAGDNHLNRRSLLAATAAGLLFGIHPLRVESVAWVSERKDVLCSFFFLLSLIAYIRHTSIVLRKVDAVRALQKTYSVSYLCSIGLFCLALLSKPMAVTLPGVLLLLDWWPLGRFSTTSAPKLIAEKIPFILLSLISSLVTLQAQRDGGHIASLLAVSLTDRVVVAFFALSSYIAKTFLPFNLTPFYPYPKHVTLLSVRFLMPMLFTLGLSILCLITFKRHKIWSSVWGCYLITLLPVLGIVQVGNQAIADRYTYLPTVGIFFLLGIGIASLYEIIARKTAYRKTISAVCLALLVLLSAGLSILTIKQIRVWRNDATLWTRVLQADPKVAIAYNNLGTSFLMDGRIAQAKTMFARAVSIDASYARALNNLAICYLETKEYDEALRYANRAAEIGIKSGDAFNTLGEIYFALHDNEKALTYFFKALSARSDDPSRYYNIALALEQLGKVTESCAYWGEYLRMGKGLHDLNDVLRHRAALGCR